MFFDGFVTFVTEYIMWAINLGILSAVRPFALLQLSFLMNKIDGIIFKISKPVLSFCHLIKSKRIAFNINNKKKCQKIISELEVILLI